MKYITSIWASIALVSFFLVIRVFDPQLVEQLRLNTFDQYIQSLPQRQSEEVVLINIGEEALDKYERIALASKKYVGYHVIEPDHQLVQEKIKKGYNFIAFSLDTLFLGTLARNQMQSLKNNQ